VPLVIDPVLVYSTYLGGSGGDSGWAVATDAAGNPYVAGSTCSDDFPTVHAAQINSSHPFCLPDAFVTKLSNDGASILFSTYLGGNSFDGANGAAVDAAGNVYITGYTNSGDFPLLNPVQAHMRTLGGLSTRPCLRPS
jgi:hypothetical protein